MRRSVEGRWGPIPLLTAGGCARGGHRTSDPFIAKEGREARLTSLSLACADLCERFASLVTSIEVGLEQYEGRAGAEKLAAALRKTVSSRSQKLALAQLLSLIAPPNQPSDLIATLLGEVDNARAVNVSLVSSGRGYTEQAPAVSVANPPSEGRPARVGLSMRPTGRWLSVKGKPGCV